MLSRLLIGRRALSSAGAALEHPMGKVWRRRDLISQLLKCEDKEKALELRDELEEDQSMPLTAEEADRMIRRYGVFGFHENVTSTLNRYRENNEEDESRVIHSTIHAFSKMKMFDEGVKIFEEHKSRVKSVSPRVYLTMLRSAAMSKNSELANRLIQEINENFEFDLSEETPSRREKMKSHRDFEEIEDRNEDKEGKPVFYKNAIQRAYVVFELSHCFTRMSILSLVSFVSLIHIIRKVTRIATFKCTLKYYENLTRASRSNTGTILHLRPVWSVGYGMTIQGLIWILWVNCWRVWRRNKYRLMTGREMRSFMRTSRRRTGVKSCLP